MINWNVKHDKIVCYWLVTSLWICFKANLKNGYDEQRSQSVRKLSIHIKLSGNIYTIKIQPVTQTQFSKLSRTV